MRTRIAVAVSLLLVACGQGSPEARQQEDAAMHSFDDPEVTRIWARMMDVIAPDRGWERARYIEFDWAVRRAQQGDTIVRHHRWDRWEGMARYEASTANGRLLAIFDTNDPESGWAWLDGRELTGEQAAEALRGAHRAHINDAYWLLMPYKWTDPGVRARYAGEQEDGEGRLWEVVELTFEDDTGYTPQNMYRAFINPETGRMERWHFLSNRDAEPAPADWVDWRRFGPIELSATRLADGEPRIFYPHLRVETEVPRGAFDPPES
jgi:hypothetical protein